MSIGEVLALSLGLPSGILSGAALSRSMWKMARAVVRISDALPVLLTLAEDMQAHAAVAAAALEARADITAAELRAAAADTARRPVDVRPGPPH